MLPAKTKDKCHTKQWCVHSVTTALRFAKGLALQFFFFFFAARTARVATSFTISKESAVIFKITFIASQFSYSYIKF